MVKPKNKLKVRMTLAGENTEYQILMAAREVFIAKGFEGARMQEIADQAGINKALLHYYFRSKDKLFEAVFSEVAGKLFPAMRQILTAELEIKGKINFLVKTYLKGISENPFIPAFVLNTLNTNPERFLKYLKKAEINTQMFQKQLDDEAVLGLIRPIKAEHLMVNIIAMCIFPFIARPIIQNIFKMYDQKYLDYLEARETEIVDFVLKSIAV
jgi:AcrR family transcriptional regulator